MKVAELAKQMVEIPSPSGQEDQIGEFLYQRLKKRFNVKKQYVEGKRFNIIATKGNPEIIFNIHIDTVPGKLPVKIEGDTLYGRGSLDAKGPLAALIIAAEKAADEGIKNFALMLDIGEELDFCGVKELMKEVAPAKLIVICEATDMKIRTSQSGLLEFKLISRGKSAHSAEPERGQCAITKLIKTINAIKNIPLKGKTVINIGLIKGGTAINVVPDYAEAKVCIRVAPEDVDLLDRIKRLDLEIEIINDFEPYVFQGDIEQIKKVFKQLKMQTSTTGGMGFTEMYFWAKKGPSVTIGPGKSGTEHSENEQVSIKALEEGCRFYYELLRNIYKEKHERGN
ncbi:M20/M25/M40 family metallo-hydrolase [Candidatus Woesearchaeota archaeon]|nr:M20/M25/M40 family metallo-hydrolase [Candidatus Woesearchaeota archaeon]MBW3006285.1 M20/M25/M40 family metallo-hydrolase [Candidatus Woesearchaeota archaeon]